MKRVRLKFVAHMPRNAAENADEYVGLEHVESWTGKLRSSADASEMTGDGLRAWPGDVLFGKLRPYLAKVWEADRTVACSSEFAVIRPREGLNSRFLSYVLLDRRFVDGMNALTYGAKMPRVSPEEIGEYEVPFPDVDHQQEIADFLDRETAKIDTLIEKKERLLELLDEKRTAFITRAVTRGLDPDVSMKDSGAEWIGEVPEHWEVVPLRRIARVVDCIHRTPTYVPEGYPLVSTTEVKPGILDLGVCTRFVGEADFADMTEGPRLPQREDIIYSRNASLGAAALVDTDRPFCMGQDVVLIRTVGDPDYLRRVLNSPIVTRQVEAVGIGSTFSRINVSTIRDLEVTVPPANEQAQIARGITAFEENIRELAKRVQDAVFLLREYRSALIANAVTGAGQLQQQHAIA